MKGRYFPGAFNGFAARSPAFQPKLSSSPAGPVTLVVQSGNGARPRDLLNPQEIPVG